MAKTQIHTIYKVQSGAVVPSVTTVLGILNKPALVHWAWELGTMGEDYRKVRDNAADIGTLAHYLILCDIQGKTPDTSEYSAADISKAETCLLKYWEWKDRNPLTPILAEEPLVSEQYHYGGTIDCLAKDNTNNLVLIDFKTGKSIYTEYFYQLAAYRQLLAENGYACDRTMILRIGRDESEGFEARDVGNLDKHFEIFRHCLEIYKLQKEVNR